MAPFGKGSSQPMNFSWQIARKVDRLDLGSFAATEFFYRNAIIFGLVRAIDPKEKKEEDDPNSSRTIDELSQSIDERINDLLGYDTTAILMGNTQMQEVKEFQTRTMSVWYELAEVIHRCKLTDQVLYQIPEAP
jgi:hypothetical protein